MATLIEDIERIDPIAAKNLRELRFYTDLDLQSLDRQDLHELLPGVQNLRKRQDIFDIIHKKKPNSERLKSLTEPIPIEGALTANGVLDDYLLILKDIKRQVTELENVLNAHIQQLEGKSKNEEEPESGSSSSVRNSATDGPVTSKSDQPDNNTPEERGYPTAVRNSASGNLVMHNNNQTNDYSPQAQGSSSSVKNPEAAGAMMLDSNRADSPPPQTQGSWSVASFKAWITHSQAKPPVVIDDYRQRPSCQESQRQRSLRSPNSRSYRREYKEVKYKTVVSGKTFGAEQQVMAAVQSHMKVETEFIENSEDHNITILFCPISSRVGSDANAALAGVKDDENVILVLMHHSHEPKHTTVYKTWTHGDNVVMHTNVFYHETKHGLIKCNQNTQAFIDIGLKLLEYSTTKIETCSQPTNARYC